jgi:hypothetical protein
MHRYSSVVKHGEIAPRIVPVATMPASIKRVRRTPKVQ